MDTLEIFGVEYTNVTGIKATDDNDQIKTYIRPQGTKSISANGTGIDVTNYASVDVAVPSSQPTLQTKTKTYTPSTSQQTESVTADSGYDGLNAVNVTVNAVAEGSLVFAESIDTIPNISIDSDGLITSSVSGSDSIAPVSGSGWLEAGENNVTIYYYGTNTQQLSTQSATTITPTESAQTAVSAGKYTTGAVTVGAISSTYVGSGITRRSSTDLTASGATVTVPSGYYSAQASKAVATGTAGIPTATKGTVSNHSVSVTPSVTNTSGFISGGTKNGTAVTVSASELVSGSETKTANGTYDVTNLASLVVDIPFSTIYTGSTNPSSSTGSNGDIYLKVVS